MPKKIFLLWAVAIIASAAVIRYVFMDDWEKPSACACGQVFSADSSIALPAARAMVGNAYYQYTLRVARIHCLKAWSGQLPDEAWMDTLSTEWHRGRAFFLSKCP